MYKRQLQQVGLSAPEAAVYDAVLRFPNATAAAIAKHTNLSRAVTTKHLRDLSQAGLIRVTTKGKRRTFVVADPAALQSRVMAQQQALNTLLPTLMSTFAAQGTTQSTAIYEGVDGITKSINQAVQRAPYLKSFSSPENFYSVIGTEQAGQWISTIESRDILSQSLYSNTPANQQLMSEINRPFNQFRPLPDGLSHPIEIIVYEQNVVFTSWYRQFSVVMESPEIAHFVEAMFDDLWEQADSKAHA